MRSWFTILVFAIVFGILLLIGAAAGYYLALYQLGKPELLALGAIGFAFLTWIGSGADLLGLLREWYKDKQQELKTPVLKYGSIIVVKNTVKELSEEFTRYVYCLRIIMSSGDGMATNCHGFIDVPKAGIRHLPIVWTIEENSIPIGDREDAYLFAIDEHLSMNSVCWYRLEKYDSNEVVTFLENTVGYDNIVDSKLQLKLVSDGKVPHKPFIKTIREIRENAQEE